MGYPDNAKAKRIGIHVNLAAGRNDALVYEGDKQWPEDEGTRLRMNDGAGNDRSPATFSLNKNTWCEAFLTVYLSIISWTWNLSCFQLHFYCVQFVFILLSEASYFSNIAACASISSC